jgi:O-antigen/teichoic acid export membrane protein
MFGVIAVANMLMVGLALFSDFGIRQSVVQSARGDEPAFLRTAWATQILRGLVLGALGLALSLVAALVAGQGWVAADNVYQSPALAPVIAVLSMTAVIAGFESSKVFQANRKLLFQGVTRLELYSQVAGLLCMLAWASLDPSIWALVSGAIAAALCRTVLSHAVLEGIPDRWAWDRTALSELLRFGKWIFLSSILGFLVNSGDRILLGGLVSSEVLGIYAVAFLLVNAVESALTKLINDLAFPALSEVARDRPGDLRRVLYRFHFHIGTIAMFLAGLLWGAGQGVVDLLYDPRYSSAGWMLGVLAAGLAAMPYRVGALCIVALGRPGILTVLTATRLVAMYAATPLAFEWFGLHGALWAIVLSAATALPVVWRAQAGAGLFDFRRECRIVPGLVAGVLVGKAAGWLMGTGAG